MWGGRWADVGGMLVGCWGGVGGILGGCWGGIGGIVGGCWGGWWGDIGGDIGGVLAALPPPATAGQPPLRTVYCQIALGSNERTLDFHACPSALALCCPHLQWGPCRSQVRRYSSARCLPAFSVFCSSSSVVIRYTAFGGPFASVDLPHPYEWNLHTAWLCL
jgi:hypothetical protein